MKKYIFLLFLSTLFVSCKQNKQQKKNQVADKVDYKIITLDSTNLAACKNGNCPDVAVSYIKFEGNSDRVKAINAKNEAELTQLFASTEETPSYKNLPAAVNGFINDYFQFKQEYPRSAASYEAKVEQTLKSQDSRSIVVKTSFYLFTGGAHGYGGVRFFNFDAQTGKYLTHKDLISDLPAFTKFVEKKFRQRYKVAPDADLNAQGFFFENGKFALPKNIAVLPKAVILLYNPYEAASYAQGQLRFVFPRKMVEQWLAY